MDDETYLDERVDVVATFGTGLNPCVPLKFRRRHGRVIEISEIGLRHPTMQGKRMVHMFDVTDGGADYRLEFNAEHLTWTLKMEADRS